MENLWLLGLQGGTWEYMGVLGTKRRYCWALLGTGVHLGVLRYWGYCQVLWGTMGYYRLLRVLGSNKGYRWELWSFMGNREYSGLLRVLWVN